MNFQNFVNSCKALHNEIKINGLNAFKGTCQELFDTYPELKTFSFVAYAPTWNDGEPCIFDIRGFSYALITDVIDDEYFLPNEVYYTNPKETTNNLYRALYDLYKNLRSDYMLPNIKLIFGEDVHVAVTKEGIKLSRYDHE